MSNTNGQLSLLAFGGLEAVTAKVFKTGEHTDDHGIVDRQSITMAKKTDIEAALGLEGDDLAMAIANGQIELKGKMLELLAKLANKDDWGGLALRASLTKGNKHGKNRKMRLSLNLGEISRPTGPSDEQIAKALGIPVEDVSKLRVKQTAQLAGIDVKPVDAPAKTEAEIMAELEKDEAAALETLKAETVTQDSPDFVTAQ